MTSSQPARPARQRRKPTETIGATDRRIAARKRRVRIVGLSLLGAAVVVLAASAWVGWRTYQAYTHLQTASVRCAAAAGSAQ